PRLPYVEGPAGVVIERPGPGREQQEGQKQPSHRFTFPEKAIAGPRAGSSRGVGPAHGRRWQARATRYSAAPTSIAWSKPASSAMASAATEPMTDAAPLTPQAQGMSSADSRASIRTPMGM